MKSVGGAGEGKEHSQLGDVGEVGYERGDGRKFTFLVGQEDD